MRVGVRVSNLGVILVLAICFSACGGNSSSGTSSPPPPPAPTYFLSGDWEGTGIDSDGGSLNVSASISQRTTSLSATLTVLAPGNVPLTYTVNGQISGSSINFSTSSSDSDVDGSATGTIGGNGLQVSGSGSDGSTGTMTWNGEQTLSGTATLAAEFSTWTGTATADGQNLTGSATGPEGTVSWTMQKVQ